MLHNARTSAERQMEGECNSQVEEITRKSYNKELQATNTTERLAETKLSSLEIQSHWYRKPCLRRGQMPVTKNSGNCSG